MKIYCHTHLDLFNEIWPDELPCLPAIGHEIQSQTSHKGGFQLLLQVCAIRWEYSGIYIPKIELHMTEFQRRVISKKGTITAFYKWYSPLVGKEVSFFI